VEAKHYNDTRQLEITSEMIEAGVSEFILFDSRFESEEDALRRIYAAMWNKRPIATISTT
jgi:hypothetical protein